MGGAPAVSGAQTERSYAWHNIRLPIDVFTMRLRYF